MKKKITGILKIWTAYVICALLAAGLSACAAMPAAPAGTSVTAPAEASEEETVVEETAKEELPEAKIFVTVNTEGMGYINYAEGTDSPEIDDEFHAQSAVINLAEPAEHTFIALPDAGNLFVKWTKNGEDFSEEPQVTVLLDESADYVAVFEEDPDWQNPVMNFVGNYQSGRAGATVECFGNEDAWITIDWGSSASELTRWDIIGTLDTETLTIEYSGCPKSVLTFNSDGEEVDRKPVYEDGSGTVTFNEDGTFTWHEDQSESGEDMVFEWIGAPEEDEEAGDPASESDFETFTSEDGWSVSYRPDIIEAAQTDDHSAQFVYLGECAGTCMLTISYVEGKQPQELLYEVTEPWGSQDDIRRLEGYFPGTEDKWGYWRSLGPDEDGTGIERSAIAGEYNGGVLLFDILTHRAGDSAMDVPMSDHLAEVIDSITYDEFEPQTEFSYVPGRYVFEHTEKAGGKKVTSEYSVTLNEDHTGTVSMQEDVDICWGSAELTGPMDIRYEYTIEGDSLLLNVDGEWLSFDRVK